MALQSLISALGEEIEDAEEETFSLFSQDIPSQNLGFVDAKATDLQMTISGRELYVTQSPGLLSSNRAGGTTGAILWKITPLFAEWITSDDNVLFQSPVLNKHSAVLELGCGISGIIAVSLGPKIERYIATDQDYILKWLKLNIYKNWKDRETISEIKHHRKSPASKMAVLENNKIEIIALDWELDSISELPRLIGQGLEDGPQYLDAIIACDCIYNEALIDPLVHTCADICQLANTPTTGKQTVCIIAQQLRSNMIFEAWLTAFHKVFRVWRVPNEQLIEGLKGGSGFVVHIGMLRQYSPLNAK